MTKFTVHERVKLSEGQQLALAKEALQAYEKHFNSLSCRYLVNLDHEPIDFRWLTPQQKKQIHEAKSMADVLSFAKKIIPPTPEEIEKRKRQKDLLRVGTLKATLSTYDHYLSDSKRYYRIEDEDYSYVLAFHELSFEQMHQIYSANSMAEIKELIRSWAQPKQEETKTEPPLSTKLAEGFIDFYTPEQKLHAHYTDHATPEEVKHKKIKVEDILSQTGLSSSLSGDPLIARLNNAYESSNDRYVRDHIYLVAQTIRNHSHDGFNICPPHKHTTDLLNTVFSQRGGQATQEAARLLVQAHIDAAEGKVDLREAFNRIAKSYGVTYVSELTPEEKAEDYTEKLAKAAPGGFAERYLKSEITRLTTDHTKQFHSVN